MAKVGTWCFLRDSTKLKSLIKYQMRKKNLRIIDLGKLSGISPDKVGKYLRDFPGRPLTQFQLVTIARVLGINIDLSISIDE